MRILLLTDGIFPFSMGGMQKHSFYLYTYLLKKNHQVDLAHCTDLTTDLSEFKHPISHLFSSNAENIFSLTFPKVPKIPGHYILSSWLYSIKLFKHYKANLNDYDLIYAQGFTAWYFLQKKSKLNSTPVLVNLHGFEMYQKGFSLKEALEKFILKIPANYIIKHADYLQSLGGRITQLIASVYPQAKVLQCSIGIEESWIKTSINPCSEHQRKFLFIGRMEHRKGLHLLNVILPTLCNDKRFEMHFIGPIPSGFQINHEQIFYHGKISDENKITEILDQMDVLLLPSLSEGMPTVILEAMARSCAIIATDVGAVSELVDSNNGLLIPANNIDALKTAILSILNSNNFQIDALKLSSIERVQNYTWNKVIERQISQFKSTKNSN
jgi:glycosyltransferase involved in cell wall biosynthesis